MVLFSWCLLSKHEACAQCLYLLPLGCYTLADTSNTAQSKLSQLLAFELQNPHLVTDTAAAIVLSPATEGTFSL